MGGVRAVRQAQGGFGHWDGGEPATVFKGKDSGLLWVRMGSRCRPARPGRSRSSYHGDLIERFIDFFRIKTSVAWYPLSLEGRTLATFDLTFNTPDAYLLASVGERVDSSRSGTRVTTRWVTAGAHPERVLQPRPVQGLHGTEPGAAPGHRHDLRGGPQEARPGVSTSSGICARRVGDDVSKSLQFFQPVYGAAASSTSTPPRSPSSTARRFPGMLHLSWVTFQQTDDQGGDEVFRAHEVAHQWWGIGVDYRTYHDRWLSEGFAEFSGLWYMQIARKSNDKYFAQLRRLSLVDPAAEARCRARSPSATACSRRTTPTWTTTAPWSTRRAPGWSTCSAILMLDLKTMNEDRFTETMQDFYRSYEGKRASTADFRRVVERHAGTDMGWFFDQWVDGDRDPDLQGGVPRPSRHGGRPVPGAAPGVAGGRAREFPDVRPRHPRYGEGPGGPLPGEGEGCRAPRSRCRPCRRSLRRSSSTISRACWRT